MDLDILQSTATRILLKVYLASDHVSDATGKTVAVVISKNGAAFGNPSAGATNATEIGNGWYYVDLSTTDTGTLGPVVVRGTATACDNSEKALSVVKATNRGMTAIPDTAVSTNASLITSGTGTAQISVSSGGVTVTTNNDKANYTLSSSGLNNVTIETGCDARQAICIIAAACAGLSTGVDTGSPVFKGIGQSSGGTTRISATASAGNRSVVTLTLP